LLIWTAACPDVTTALVGIAWGMAAACDIDIDIAGAEE
jgi:hypothetical protein